MELQWQAIPNTRTSCIARALRTKSARRFFSKLSREITVAAKNGIPDPDANARLRAAVIAARAQSMPKDNIQRAIDKAAGSDAENYEEIRYEGFGPGGVAIIVEALTDNRNRMRPMSERFFPRMAAIWERAEASAMGSSGSD